MSFDTLVDAVETLEQSRLISETICDEQTRPPVEHAHQLESDASQFERMAPPTQRVHAVGTSDRNGGTTRSH